MDRGDEEVHGKMKFHIGMPLPPPITRMVPPEGAVVFDELGRRLGVVKEYEGEGSFELWVEIILDEGVTLSPETDTIWFVRGPPTISYGFRATFEKPA